MDYELVYSKRKTVSIRVDEHGCVHVRAPHRLSRAECDRIVDQKRSWIKKQQANLIEMEKKRAAFSASERKTLLYLGKDCPVVRQSNTAAYWEDGSFVLDSHMPVMQQAAAVYRLLAKQYLFHEIQLWAPLMGVSPANVSVTGAKTRWGSCSGKGRLNFSWYLITAEPETVNYVLIHELAHLKEHNHSPRFWSVVEAFCPDYRVHRQKLNELAKRLTEEGYRDDF